MTPSYHNTSRDNVKLTKPLKWFETPTKSQISDKPVKFSGKILSLLSLKFIVTIIIIITIIILWGRWNSSGFNLSNPMSQERVND